MKELNFTVLGEELHHQEMCDASTAIAVDEGNYFIVGSDEDNILRVYQAKRMSEKSKSMRSLR